GGNAGLADEGRLNRAVRRGQADRVAHHPEPADRRHEQDQQEVRDAAEPPENAATLALRPPPATPTWLLLSQGSLRGPGAQRRDLQEVVPPARGADLDGVAALLPRAPRPRL